MSSDCFFYRHCNCAVIIIIFFFIVLAVACASRAAQKWIKFFILLLTFYSLALFGILLPAFSGFVSVFFFFLFCSMTRRSFKWHGCTRSIIKRKALKKRHNFFKPDPTVCQWINVIPLNVLTDWLTDWETLDCSRFVLTVCDDSRKCVCICSLELAYSFVLTFGLNFEHMINRFQSF